MMSDDDDTGISCGGPRCETEVRVGSSSSEQDNQRSSIDEPDRLIDKKVVTGSSNSPDTMNVDADSQTTVEVEDGLAQNTAKKDASGDANSHVSAAESDEDPDISFSNKAIDTTQEETHPSTRSEAIQRSGEAVPVVLAKANEKDEPKSTEGSSRAAATKTPSWATAVTPLAGVSTAVSDLTKEGGGVRADIEKVSTSRAENGNGAADNSETQDGDDIKEKERRARGVGPNAPGAVAIPKPLSSAARPGYSDPTSATVLPQVTILAQPEPYQVDNSPSNHELQGKVGERQTRDLSTENTMPGAVPSSITPGTRQPPVNHVENKPAGMEPTGKETNSEQPPTTYQHSVQSAAPIDPARPAIQNQAGLVTATLVTEAIQAVQVTIDEEQGGVGSDVQQLAHENLGDRDNGGKLSRLWKGSRSRLRLVLLVAILLVVAIVLGIVLPLTGINDTGDRLSEGPSSDPAQRFDYPCYTSTLQLLKDQIEDVNLVNDTYILCPNITIQVGTLVIPDDDVEYFDKGDYPIWVIRPGITVQCGLDGRSENYCILDGGFIQVIAMPTILLPPEYSDQALLDQVASRSKLENVTIRGITFIGEIQRAGPSFGTSVAVSQSGNFTFEDCHWTGMTNQGSTVSVYRNDFAVLPFVPMPMGSIDVKIVNSSFTNIVSGSPLLAVTSQSLTIESCLFDELLPTLFSTPTCDLVFGPNDAIRTDGGCVGLLYCGDTSVCDVFNSCLLRSTVTGPSFIYFVHNTSDGSMLNNYVDTGTVVGPYDCEWAVGSESVYERKEDAVGNFECTEAFEADRCSLF